MVAVVALAVLAPSVAASLFLVLDPPSGPPGTRVIGVTGGRGAASLAAGSTLDAYLAPAAASPGATDDPSLIRIGGLVVDAAGDGRIKFAVPVVAAGPVSLYVFCPPCAPASAGRTLLWVGDFRVTVDAPATDTVISRDGGSWDGIGIIGAGVVLAGLGLLVVLQRRGRRG